MNRNLDLKKIKKATHKALELIKEYIDYTEELDMNKAEHSVVLHVLSDTVEMLEDL